MATIGHNNLNAKLVDPSTPFRFPLFLSQYFVSDDLFLSSFRQVLLGDMGAGKSSLVLRFVKGQFLEFQVVFLSSCLISSF